MRVPLSWLRDYVPLSMPVGELAERLSISAAEVNTIEPRGPVDENGNHGLFLVGKVLEAGKHPNADRLQLCQVDVGEGEPRQIVCGAWNFGAGATVAVALPGAKLPGADGPLGEAKLRGEVSRGMILSERELELGADHAGIMVLPEAEPGTPLADVLPLADLIMDVEPTGNRVDLLSVYGIAREVAALFGVELAPPPGIDPEPHGTESVNIRIDDLEAARATWDAPSATSAVGTVAAVAPGAPHGRGDAPDLQRRRRHELRDARRSATHSMPSIAPRWPATRSSFGAPRAARSSGRSTASSASSTSGIS